MKRQTRIYNVIFPIWILILFPQLLVFVIPGNLIVDCAVLFFTLLALKHTQKGAVVKKLWWRFWLLGFAADAIGVVWMFLGWLTAARVSQLLGTVGWLEDVVMALTANCFRHPAAFLWTLGGVSRGGRAALAAEQINDLLRLLQSRLGGQRCFPRGILWAE